MKIRFLLASLLLLILCQTQAQTTVTTGGWFIRGTGTNYAEYSMVIPLDGQLGVTNAPSLVGITYTNLGATNLYHLNGTNTHSQLIVTNRFTITNAVAAFGSQYGGSPLYFNQAYQFGAYAGDFSSAASSAVWVSIVNRTNGAWVGAYSLAMAVPSNTNNWNNNIENGLSATYSIPGMTVTCYSDWQIDMWGATNNYGDLTLTHVANTNAAGYEYTFWVEGGYDATTNWMVLSATNTPFASPLYTLDFDPLPPSLPNFVAQPQFSGIPLPPFYQNKSLTELLAVQAVVTNAVGSSATNCLELDDSPELRDNPTLDQFVNDMNSNALALTSYVFNQIELTDAVAYNSNTNALLDTSINLGGINRSAYATYMEGQGSPAEQCSLLIYLLRRAGVPACYIYPPTDGVQMLDARLSSLLRMQIHGAVDDITGQIYTTNTLISVNYPWVAAYMNGQWVHLFPWIKDTEVTEGLNLYDYMPPGYNSGALWVEHYLTGDTNILSLSSETDVPSTLFPLFLQQALLTNAPGVSVDDIGTTAINRQVQFTKWSDFPTPFAVTNGVVNTVTNLTTITNIYPSWTNIWDTINIRVYSSARTNVSIQTGDLRMCDLQDRKFLIRTVTNGASDYNVFLSLAPIRPSATNKFSFTNDASLLNQETLGLTNLVSTDTPIDVTFTRKRHRTEPSGVTNANYWSSYLGVSESLQASSSATMHLGDLAAICLHSGRVSKEMLLPWAEEYWNMQQEVAANPSLTNTISPDILQGTLPYLMGMSYYERWCRFGTQLANLHKVTLGSVVGQGLSIVGAQCTTNTGALIKPLNLYHPHVDMEGIFVSSFGDASLRSDQSADSYVAADSLHRLYITEGSAQEHKITEDFYNQPQGISSVRLLLDALQQTNPPGIDLLTVDNYKSFASTLSGYDSAMWAQVAAAFTNPPNYIADVFITAKPITNTAVGYSGMGCMIYAPTLTAALISGNGLPANGGWGEDLGDPFYSPPDYNDVNLSFNTSDDDNWSVAFTEPSISDPSTISETVSMWDEPTTFGDLSAGSMTYGYGGADEAEDDAFSDANYFLGYSGSSASADSYEDAANNGGDYSPDVGPDYAQLAAPVADPVNAVTGEFYIDATDLNLPGPMSLFVRRNYSSQNVDLGDSPFGYGWRPAYTPYLRMVTNNVIYAAELDGTVVAYRQVAGTGGTNYWKPLAADNPQLNNRSAAGVGSTANLFNNYITTNLASGTTNFFLNGADGSVRYFKYASYPITTTNYTLTRTRPYLQTWTDAKSNSYSFTYETNTTLPDFGQLTRVQCSDGNFFGFFYDSFAHITEAYTGDGRELLYDYDSHGDLVTVTLPDESQINYVYQHSQTVTNTTTNIFSLHLLTQEQKPDGRTVANTYDSLRRVTVQAATVGTGLSLVTNAYFSYSNNFTNLTNTVITGTTYLTNVFGKVTTYQYTSNLITSIVDALGQTDTQVWFVNTNDTGYYPHSLKSRTDKRGLTTAYQYDTNGNLAQVTFTGNLTGGTSTNDTATYTYAYTAHNLVSTETDPSTNQTYYYYTNSACPMSPTAVVKEANGTPVTTNQYFYTNIVQVVTNGAVLGTNSAYGMVQRIIRGGAETNDFLYSGQGLLTQSTRHTGTADPDVTTALLYSERNELIQKTDALGRSSHYAYDAMGRVTEQEVYESGATTPEGFTYYYYNENGELVWKDGSRYNPEDYVWYDYDGAGRKITEMHWRSEANPNGSGVEAPAATTNLYATTFYQYDAFNNLTQVTDPLGNYTVKQYDAIGQMTNEVAYSAAGTALATNYYGHEPGGLVSATTNALGGVTTKVYTSAGKLMFQSNPDGSTNAWQYYLDGRPYKEFLPNGNYWQTVYNDAQLTVTKYFCNASGILATNIQVMDARGNVVQNIDADGYTSTNAYDGLSRIKLAAGPAVITIANIASGLSPSTNFVTNVLQHFTAYVYDAAGQTLTTSNALGESIVTTSDALGRPTQVSMYNAGSGTPVRVTSTYYSPDHQSITVTNGTGTNAIATTTYTDNDGHTVLTIGYPTNGVTEFTWWKYDQAGNCIAEEQCSSNASGITVWATNVWAYDGMNRKISETGRDGATTTYSLDALGDVTNRSMPGGLSWSATYLNDGRMASEQESGGSLTARSLSYTYYAAGSPFAGMSQSVTDGRGTTTSNSYDDFLRVTNVTTTGTAGQQQTYTSYQYDPRGSLINLGQSFASSATGPSTAITRVLDGYGQVSSEIVTVGGSTLSSSFQGFDTAGRRNQLNGTPYNYQADGQMVESDGSTYSYANNGLLTARYNASRNYTVNMRDGRGRVLSTTTAAGLTTLLSETLNWRNDGRLSSYNAVRGDFTDVRNYGYSPYAQRLTQESFDVGASQLVTNTYAIDNGATGGLGILTSQAQSGALSDTWSLPGGGLDGISRVIQSQNTVLNRPATGTAVGAATVTATLDSNPVNIQFDGPNSLDGTWRANLNLFPGSHTLAVSAVDPSGQYSASTNISFTCNGGATDTLTNTYDGNGNITQRIWINSSGVTNKIENLTWDAFNRLIQVTDRDTNSSGFNFVSIYDGFGRRVRTIETMVTNGVAITNALAVSTVDSWYDPLVEFLEVGVNANGVFTTKTYGPDASGHYGGMQGVGGLETIYVTGHTSPHGSVEDYFGNVLATISNSVVTWTGARYSSYGPVPGYQPPTLNLNTSIELCLGWHGLRIDPSGDYRIGARTYSPVEGRFISADPMGHSASQDLYSFCGADPVNFYDPTGRYGKQYSDSDGYDSGPASMPDDNIVEEMHTQDTVVGLLNLATFGIADPLVGAISGYDLEGNQVSRGESATDLVDQGDQLGLAALMALPMLIPGAGEADVMAEAGAGMLTDVDGAAVMGAGEGGLAAEGGDALADTTAGSLPQTSEQMEFPFAKEDLSGQLADVGSSAAEAPTEAQVDAQAVATAPSETQMELDFANGNSSAGSTTAANPLTTAKNQAVFWSGIPNGADTAAQWANENNGVTLEQTVAAKGIQLPAWDSSNPASVSAWTQASQQFAAGASGDVTVLQGNAVRVNSVWGQTEFSALQANENVTSITAVNPATAEQVLLWSR